MTCSNCGAENRAERRFCSKCGSPLGLRCPACGAANQPGDLFCGECGAALESARAPARIAVLPARPDAPVAERRLVSVLFLDLVGFTALSEARDAEEVRDLLSRYFDTCRTVIESYGGTIEKFIGDAVMALWGAPVSNEDDAERAVRAALELIEAVAALGQEVGATGLAVRGGVLSGEAVVNLGAMGQGMVAGDLVNTASRMQAAAEPGTVLVGESTFHSASGAVAFAKVGDLTVKGKEAPIPAWRALRVVGQRKGVGRSEKLEPPFVGRSEELGLIKELLHTTAREGKARLVSVTGIPGIGKSRLVWEFLKYTDGLAGTYYWHQGRCPAYGEGIAFWALGEMVRMRAGIAEGEDASSSQLKLAATLVEFIPDADERRWLEPRLAHLLGLADAPPGDRQEMFSAWRTFFERIAERGPTILGFEELHWADPGLIDFIESILEWSVNHPIMVVALARPEFMERRPTWGAGQRRFTSLHLEPLQADAMLELLHRFVHGLPDDVAEQIRQRAEGVPLYAVEMVRVLADRGVVVPREGGYEVAGPLGDVVIPDSLHALIQSRLDSLPAEERSLLQDAAIVGQTFTLAALAAVSRRDAPGIETQLRRLVRKELVSVDADPRSPERGQYGFVQSLIREVAYGTLARRERSAKHLAAARHFEGLGDEELAGVVAAHYVEAHRSAPEGADTAEVAAQARRWLSEAGRRALTLGSPEQALVFFEQALEVTSDAADRAPLLRLAGDAALRTSNPEQAAVYLGEAAELFASLGDRTAAGSAAAQRVRALSALSRYTEAIEQGMRASESLGSDDDEARADLGAALSDAHSASASPQEALRWAETALAAAERVEGPTLLLRAIFSRVWALYNAGRHREAGILAQGLVELAERAGVLAGQARGLMAVSLLRLHDEPRVTLEACAEAAALARRVGERPLETSNLLNAAETGIFKGYWADARAAIADVSRRDLRTDHRIWLETLEALLLGLSTDARAGLEELSHNAENQLESQYLASRTTFLRIRAFLCLAADEFEAAREDVAQLVAADPSGINTALALAIQARAALWMRDREGARATVEAMAGFHGRWMATARQTVEAGLAALEGRVAEASGAYRQAVETWRTLDVPLDLALCDIDMVDLLGPQSADMSAAAEAEEILTRLGATPFLERLRHLRARATISA